MTGSYDDRLFKLLPALFGKSDPGQTLEALMGVLGLQVSLLEDDVDGLYKDCFVETCSDQTVALVGQLVGVDFPDPDDLPINARTLVADAIAWQRRKGTTSVLQRMIRAATGWTSLVVDSQSNVTAAMRQLGIAQASPGQVNIYIWPYDVAFVENETLTKANDPPMTHPDFDWFGVAHAPSSLLNVPMSQSLTERTMPEIEVPYPLSASTISSQSNLASPDYFGREKTLLIVNGDKNTEVTPDQITVLDDDGAPASITTTYAIMPSRGFVLAKKKALVKSIKLSYGTFLLHAAARIRPAHKIAIRLGEGGFDALKTQLHKFKGREIAVQLPEKCSSDANVVLDLPPGCHLTLTSTDDASAAISGWITVKGGRNSVLTLDGVRVLNGILVGNTDPIELRLRHCAVESGIAHFPASKPLRLLADHCRCGRLALMPSDTLVATATEIGCFAPRRAAGYDIGPVFGAQDGPAAELSGVSVYGAVKLRRLIAARDVFFGSSLEVTDRDEGKIEHSFVPGGRARNRVGCLFHGEFPDFQKLQHSEKLRLNRFHYVPTRQEFSRAIGAGRAKAWRETKERGLARRLLTAGGGGKPVGAYGDVSFAENFDLVAQLITDWVPMGIKANVEFQQPSL